MAWQRWLGESILRSGTLPTRLGAETFTASGSAWLPQEWLFATLAAAAQRAALAPAFDLAVASCAVLALALVVRRAAAAGSSALGTSLCVLCAGVAMLESFGVRAQVAGWPLLVVFCSLLERDASWLLCGAVAVAWANIHAGAVLAPVLAAAWAAGVALRDRALSSGAARAALVALATLFAVAVNPFGFGLIAYATALVRSPVKDFIREWQPASFSDASFVWGALPLLAGTAVFASFEGRRSPQRLCAVALALALLLAAARNIPLFALIVAPYAALGFTRVLRLAGGARSGLEPRLGTVAAACVFGVAGAGAVRMWRAPAAPAGGSALIARLAALPGPHRLLCQDYAWCGAAVGDARIRVFLDGRADPYPLRVWEAAFRIAHCSAGWQQALQAYRVDAIVAARDTCLGGALQRSDGWHTAGRSGSYELFVRRSPPQR